MLNQLALPFGLFLHRADENDLNFIAAVFFSTRDYFYQLPLPASQVETLLKQQFQMQQASYVASFPLAKLYIIELHGKPVGKLMVNAGQECLHLIDIALIGEVRSKGYGTALLRALKKWAQQQELHFQLSVDQQNIGAKKLYLRLGFNLVESSSTHDTLQWK